MFVDWRGIINISIMANEKITTKQILFLAAGIVGISILSKFMQGLGIWKSAETKQIDNQISDPTSFWNPNYYKQFSTYNFPLTRTQAESLAKRIYDAFGMFNDCEECVYSVFYELRAKSSVSYLAEVFQAKYGEALLPFLRGGIWPQDRLSDNDVYAITNFLNKLPNN